MRLPHVDFRSVVPAVILFVVTVPSAPAQMDMLPQIFRDLPPELQQGIPQEMSYREYRQLNRNVDFFTMFMSAMIPGYALAHVERPGPAWAVAGIRIAGYGMMATAVARQWDHWRDLTQLRELPDPSYQRYINNLLLFSGGVAVNIIGWAFDVLGAYHIAKSEKDFVTYKYGLRTSYNYAEEQREITYIRALILQNEPRERQIRRELPEALARYADRYPDGEHRAEVEYYRGTLASESGDYEEALLYFTRQLFFFPDQRFSIGSQQNAIAIVQRNRREWREDWGLLIAALDGDEAPFGSIADHVDSESEARTVTTYMGFFAQLQSERFRRLFVAEARNVADRNRGEAYAADALRAAADTLVLLGEHKDAVIVYTELAGVYPDSEYWAYAVLRAAQLLEQELDEPHYAQRFKQRLLERYPDSPEAAEVR